MIKSKLQVFWLICIFCLTCNTSLADTVKIGLNYPQSGPYAVQGLDQQRAAQLAVEEINKAGGILGKQVQLVTTNSQSKVPVSVKNVTQLIDEHDVKMVFGGSSSAVAIAAGKVCKEKNRLFFGTLTYSNTTTGKAASRHSFRECSNAWMAAKALASYLKKNYSGKKYYYITADYTWGHSTEESVRKFTGTIKEDRHQSTKTPFPGATKDHFTKALKAAEKQNPDVLVLVLFGGDMVKAVKLATEMGLKDKMQIVVPNLTLGMAQGAGPEVMQGVIGSLPWCWKVPYKYNYAQGKKFVENFAKKYNRYPSTSGASAYTILYEYKDAVERAKTFDTASVIKELEDHKYQRLKGSQKWRKLDHQSIQTVYAVKCNDVATVNKDKFKLDYFEIISSISGTKAARTRNQWKKIRTAAGLPTQLEELTDITGKQTQIED